MKLTIPINQKYQKPLAKIARSIADVLDPPSSRRERKPKPFSVLVSMAQSELTVKLVDNEGSETVPPLPPSPMGFGFNVTGARGAAGTPSIVFVTSLNDSGAGTLRAALEGTISDRIVIIMTSGTVVLASEIISTPTNVSLLGHTAPGKGLIVTSSSGFVNALIQFEGATNNVLVRHIRFRGSTVPTDPGNGGNKGIYLAASCQNVWIDQCSFAFGSDAGVDVAGYSGVANTVQNVTVSNCLFTWPIGSRQNCLNDGFATGITYYNNLWSNSLIRNPKWSSVGIGQIVNNLMVDNGTNVNAQHVLATIGDLQFDYVANFTIRNNALFNPAALNHFELSLRSPIGNGIVEPQAYVQGNLGFNRTNQAQDENLVVVASERSKLVGTPFADNTGGINYAAATAVLGDNASPFFADRTSTTRGAGCLIGGRDTTDANALQTAITRVGGGAITDPATVGGVETITPVTRTVGTEPPNLNQMHSNGLFLEAEMWAETLLPT